MSSNIHWHDTGVSREDKVNCYGHNPVLIWFTGLSASGKSTIATALYRKLLDEKKLVYLLDGDNVRHGLNKDLGFSDKDRDENIRRIAEVSKLFVDAGVITIACFISPFEKQREFVRSKLGDDYIEVFVDTSVEECEKRDPKGLYAKARKGEIKDFTGVSSPYEAPKNPDVLIDGNEFDVDEVVDKLYEFLCEKSIL